jgi:broad specificity phosphatase PhoE
MDSAFYGLGFPDESLIKKNDLLREMYFGSMEGVYFDNLPDEKKAEFADPKFRAPDGESWEDVKDRAHKFVGSLSPGKHLVVTHGGWMCSYLYTIGITEMPNNCSAIGIGLKDKEVTPDKIEFYWEYPKVNDEELLIQMDTKKTGYN